MTEKKEDKPPKKAIKKPTKKANKKPAKNKITKPKVPKKMGRPQVEIDWESVVKLAGIFCTKGEICSFIDVSPSSLERHCKKKFDETFDELYKKWSGTAKVSLRRMQYQSAQRGSVPMQIFLGKQYLGQKDNPIEGESNKGAILEAIHGMIAKAKEKAANA